MTPSPAPTASQLVDRAISDLEGRLNLKPGESPGAGGAAAGGEKKAKRQQKQKQQKKPKQKQAAAAQEEIERLRSAHADAQKRMEQLTAEPPSSVFLTGD